MLYTDSTHLKANANKNRYDLAVVAKSRADYWDALDAAIEEDRTAHGKKPKRATPRSARCRRSERALSARSSIALRSGALIFRNLPG